LDILNNKHSLGSIEKTGTEIGHNKKAGESWILKKTCIYVYLRNIQDKSLDENICDNKLPIWPSA
jgi:hypothetical protein